MSQEAPAPVEPSRSYSTESLIQRLAAGDSLHGIVEEHFIDPGAITTQEIAEFKPADFGRENLPYVLKWLNAERRKAGRLEGAIIGALQYGSNEWMAEAVMEAPTWQDLGELVDPEAYERAKASYKFANFPPAVTDFVRVTSGLSYRGRQEAAAKLESRDPGWQDVSIGARTHRLTAHVQMWVFMDELIPGFTDTIAAIRKKQTRWLGDALEFARAETGFSKLPAKVMQLDARSIFQDQTRWAGYTNRPQPFMLETMVTTSDVVLGYAATHALEGVSSEDVLRILLEDDVRRTGDKTRFTQASVPFNSFEGEGRADFHHWADDVRGYEGDPDAGERGGCPVQHAFVPLETFEGDSMSVPAAMSTVRGLQVFSMGAHGHVPIFSRPPRVGEVTTANVILAGAKPGGILYPGSGGLEQIASLAKERQQAS